jgi:hypothetical protein
MGRRVAAMRCLVKQAVEVVRMRKKRKRGRAVKLQITKNGEIVVFAYSHFRLLIYISLYTHSYLFYDLFLFL